MPAVPLKGGQNVFIQGERRTGKSSLIYETVRKTEKGRIISGQQLKFLTGLARIGGYTPTSSQFLKQSGIPQASSAQAALKRLLDLKILFHYEKDYRFVNPFFRAWLLYKNF